MNIHITSVLLSAVLLAGSAGSAQAISVGPGEDYAPEINPEDFTTEITNPHLTLPVGRVMVYESETDEGLETIEIVIPGWTREVMGVETLVFWDRVYLEGELIEDTRDYLAQHTNGDVWYFGEHVDNYENGRLVDHDGAWLAGEDGAQPGIWTLGTARVGDEYRQEYYAGVAEDMARIESINETVVTPYGTFENCVKTFEFSPLFSSTANKFDCPEVGGVALEVDLVGPENPVEQRAELVGIEMLNVALPDQYAQEGVVASGRIITDDELEIERGLLGDDDGEDADGAGDNDVVAIVIAVLIGLVLGVLVQRYVLSKEREKAGAGVDSGPDVGADS